MASSNRPLLRLKKNQEIVPAEEDRRIEIGIYDVLLPCRKYEISYKIAVLGKVSPSLEFLLRLLKAVPGLSEGATAAFFGYSRTEIAYVLNEALGPRYIERKEDRLWLTAAGDALFKEGEEEPTIFSVEDRRRTIGFDLLAIAPQQPKSLDTVEQWLPELPIEDGAGTGKVADRISERFGRFFHELSERSDREQFQRRDLYSIDSVIAKDRFQAPVRIQVFAQASSPSLPEIDLSSWRADHEIADRPQIENSAALLIDDLKVTPNRVGAALGYEALTQLAPEFLKEFILQSGFAATRYWREAVGRAGEPRVDRPTIPVVGPLHTESNARRLLNVIEYGLRDKSYMPELILSVAPQTGLWGATTQQRDILMLLKNRMAPIQAADSARIKAVCLFAGKPPRYIEREFDQVHSSDATVFSPSLEMLVVPHIAMAAVVHAPIGATVGQAVALGFASFDKQVLIRAQGFVAERLRLFFHNDALYDHYVKVLAPFS